MKFLTLFIAFLILSICTVVGQTIFTVTNTNDSGAGSLRQAILDANGTAGTDTIVFDIPGAGPHTIQPTSALPTIFDPVIIDGTTEPDFAGTPIIELDGSNAGAANGLTITAGNSTVRGLVINRFAQNGVLISGSGATGNWVQGNYIGTDVTGTTAMANNEQGIRIDGGAQFNVIGTNGDGNSDAAERNLVSGNTFNGIFIKDQNTDQNIVAGNYVGTNAAGTAAIANGEWGVGIWNFARLNRVGTDGNGVADSTERNLISGNTFDGVVITFSAEQNVIAGNYIGTDVTGTVAIPNNAVPGTGGVGGISIANGARLNRIGTNADGLSDELERNIISGNIGNGVTIFNDVLMNSEQNVIAGNYIGTDVSGTIDMGNTLDGVKINGASDNTIGGTTVEERNIISGNEGAGITISDSGTTGNMVLGNFIGTDVTGTVALGNSGAGILIVDSASFNTVGGITEGERNIISGNNAGGVAIFGPGTSNNIVSGNYIGTDVTGTVALGDSLNGIAIGDGANSNTVGGITEGERNVISGNSSFGLLIVGLNNGAINNAVLGNYIGTDYSGMSALPNLLSGVAIILGASNNTIGGTEVGAGNVISGNQMGGILIGLDSPKGNIVQGNYIGTNATGEGALGNGFEGIAILPDAVDNLVGGDEAGAGNIIAFNAGTGILLNDTSTTTVLRNRLSRNSIFSNGTIGIDLSLNPDPPFRDGVTPNDPGDADTGPNNLQNFPVITSADIDGNGDLLIGYNVDSDPVNSTYPLTIEFFESDTSGQGETFVGADQYTVTDFNNGGKTVILGNAGGLGITDGDIIVATTTDSVGNTSEFSSLDTVVTDISEIINNLPEAYALYQNYPNPFNPVSKIKYDIPKISFVTIIVYDVLGSEIATLVNEEKPVGSYEVEFDATKLSSGIYFYRFKAGDPSTGSGQGFVETKKMILLR